MEKTFYIWRVSSGFGNIPDGLLASGKVLNIDRPADGAGEFYLPKGYEVEKWKDGHYTIVGNNCNRCELVFENGKYFLMGNGMVELVPVPKEEQK